MMNNKLKGSSVLTLVSCAGFLLLFSRFLSISKIAGSGMHLSFFSLFDSIMPLMGAVSFGFAGFIVVLRTITRVAFFGLSPFSLLYHIPGLCAAASWSSSRKLISVGIPLLCIALFLLHPVGFKAAPYVLYWFIPVFIAFLQKPALFLRSLSSTFIAHAVGSVLWLYNLNTVPALWLNLIPVVLCERLIFASCATLFYWAVVKMGSLSTISISERLQRKGNA